MNLADVIFVEDLIVFIFRVINFAVLLALLGYGFRQYALPSLKETYDIYYGYFDHLIYSHSRLVDESREIDRAKEKDRREQDLLKERVMLWKEVVEHQQGLRKQQREKQIIALNDRLLLQQSKITEYRLRAQIMPLAFADARKQLIARANNQHFQQATIEKTKTLLRKVH